MKSKLLEARNHGLAVLLLVMLVWTSWSWWIEPNRLHESELLPKEFVLDLNSATEAELNLLPGVGPKLAQDILRFRNDHGGFQSVDDLLHIKGIKDARIASLRKHLQVSDPIEFRNE